MAEHRKPSDETVAVHAGRPAPSSDGPVNPPISLSATLHAGGPHGYGREHNDTVVAFEDAIGQLEGGTATAYSSGMGAANAIFDLFPPGAHVVASRYSYSGVAARLKEMADAGRIDLRLVDVTEQRLMTPQIADSLYPASWVWVESPTNPMLEVCDIRETARTAREVGARLVVDGTFMTPARQKPLELGADIVMHSATKAISGHSDLLMGVAVTRDSGLATQLMERRVLLGAMPSAFDAYLALRGLRTLFVRIDRAEQTAMEIAERLHNHPRVSAVHYPGLAWHKNADVHKNQALGPGTVMSFEVRGTAEEAEQVTRNARLMTHATSLGGVETLIERRRRWAGENPEVPETLIRISFGIENSEDLWRDLQQALDKLDGLGR